MSQKPQECFTCRDAGFPGQMFYFAGKKGDVWLMRVMRPPFISTKYKTTFNISISEHSF
jgi:hypothetical protein